MGEGYLKMDVAGYSETLVHGVKSQKTVIFSFYRFYTLWLQTVSFKCISVLWCQVDWHSGNLLDLYSGVGQFESRPRHRSILTERFRSFPRFLQINIWIVHRLVNDHAHWKQLIHYASVVIKMFSVPYASWYIYVILFILFVKILVIYC